MYLVLLERNIDLALTNIVENYEPLNEIILIYQQDGACHIIL